MYGGNLLWHHNIQVIVHVRVSVNVIFGPSSNVKLAFRMSKCDIRLELNDKIGIMMSKCDIRPEIECQNRISNVKMQFGPNSNVKIGFRVSK